MRNALLLFIVLFVSSGYTNAQWSIGGKAGINFSNINYPGSIADPSYLTGLNIGFVSEYRLNTKLALQSELLYSTRGYKEKLFVITNIDSNLDKGDLTCRFHYIDIPVLVKYYIGGFHLHAGPQFGLFLSQNAKLDKEKQSDEIMGEKQPFDFGLSFGLGYETQQGFFLDGRYILGLTSCYKNVDSFQNRSIQLSLGYKFQL